jgi:hypothetical protein
MITQVANPSSVPSAVSDYEAQNAHISAFNNIVNNQPFILTNSGGTGLPAIKLGAYIQYGGNLYVVDTEDYAITGTPVDGNNYIRISGTTTLTAEWIQDISSYVWNEVYGYKESGSYFLLPYLVVKNGTEYSKYTNFPVYPSFTDQDLKTTDSPTFAGITPHIRYSDILSSFASPNASPYGLTFDGTNLISCDFTTERIYIHNGVSSDILGSFASPSGVPYGLAFDGTNLISCDNSTKMIYIHNGVSSSILSSFASPSADPTGLTFDGTNLISCDNSTKMIYIHNGVSSDILSSFASPNESPRGLAFDGTNLISCYFSTKMIYIHNGVSSDILSSFASPNESPRGLAFDGTTLISCDSSTDMIYIHHKRLEWLY